VGYEVSVRGCEAVFAMIECVRMVRMSAQGCSYREMVHPAQPGAALSQGCQCRVPTACSCGWPCFRCSAHSR
jgi:hypothetical protein